jgi:uncharacterized protein
VFYCTFNQEQESKMVNSGWSGTESPFHRGELAIQARLGIQKQMDQQGRRVIRDYLPDQFRQFFAQLPYVIVGTVDAVGSPWAFILVGEPGFLSAPSDRTLQVVAKPLFGDPLATILANGIDIGLLGIELHTRRRNRLNGTVTGIHADGFEVQVKQSFGNCPQYIQARRFELDQDEPSLPKSVHQITTLGTVEETMITTADTFFITTAYQDDATGAARGVDVSHRGGKPGFVRIDDHQTLTIPDFSGNGHFNTFGNLELNPRAGLLFVDFGQGNLLYLTGTAEVIWKGAEITAYEGAERLFRFRLHQGYRADGSSPFLNHTGSW